MTEGSDALDEVRKTRLLLDRWDKILFESIARFVGQRVLDVGCGHGNLVPFLLDRDLLVTVDIDQASVTVVHEQFRAYENVRAETCDITDEASLSLSRYGFDTVICLNTLEHIRDDARALQNMATVLSPGGQLILIVPALEWLFGSMDESIGHFRRYSKRSLSAKLRPTELETALLDYVNILGILGWFLNGRIFRREVPPPGQLRLFNRVYPIVAAVEARLPHPVGLSLVCISRKS